MIHSPKVVKIELVAKGSGNFRSNLKFGWRKMSKNELLNPKIKNRVMKLRKGAVRRKRAQAISSIKFDKIESDNIKKILWVVWLTKKYIFIRNSSNIENYNKYKLLNKMLMNKILGRAFFCVSKQVTPKVPKAPKF